MAANANPSPFRRPRDVERTVVERQKQLDNRLRFSNMALGAALLRKPVAVKRFRDMLVDQ
jgi:hypothetical protein